MKRKIIIVVLVLLCFVSIILGVYFIVHNKHRCTRGTNKIK